MKMEEAALAKSAGGIEVNVLYKAKNDIFYLFGES